MYKDAFSLLHEDRSGVAIVLIEHRLRTGSKLSKKGEGSIRKLFVRIDVRFRTTICLVIIFTSSVQQQQQQPPHQLPDKLIFLQCTP